MRYLILGCCGMAGHMLGAYLQEQGAEVIGFARRDNHICKTEIGDARDTDRLHQVIVDARADVVVNAIGILNRAVDINIANGIYINSYLPHFAARSAAEAGSMFFHLSTDCVFSGQRGGYNESDLPDEVSWYGRTKALGEVTAGEHGLTIRTSIVGPEINSSGVGLFHWFMQQTDTVQGYREVFWSGVTTLELAKFIWFLRATDYKGLLHLSNNHKISKYNLLSLFNRYRRQQVHIVPVDEPVSDKTLFCTQSVAGYHVPTYEKMIDDQANWIKSHEELYSMYEVK